MIVTSPKLLINYIYFKKRKVNLSVRLTIVFGLKCFVGTDTLVKIASEATAKGISEVKAVDIPEKNSSPSSFDGFSSQQLITPTIDPTLPSNTHYVIKNEEKKDVHQQHKEMQKQNYTADASIKKAEEHKKLQQDQGSSSVDNKPKITIGAGAGALIALEHHKKNLESNNNQMNDPQNIAHSITPMQQPTTSQNAEGTLIDQNVTEAETNHSKIIDKSSTDQHLPNQQIAETIPNEQKNAALTPNTILTDKENQDKPITNAKITEQMIPEEKSNDQPITDTKTTDQDVSETSKSDSNTTSDSNFNDSNKEDKDNHELPKSDQSTQAEKKDEIDKKALEQHKNNLKEVLEDIKKLGKDENNNNDNIKPSEIPPKMKGSYKSQSGKEYTTEITSKTTPDDISDANLLIERKKRELIKDDLGNTATIFKTQDNNNVVVGLPKNKAKLSPLGQAYSPKTSQDINDEKVMQEIASKEIAFKDLMIIPPPPGTEECFIETGLQKHLVVVFDTSCDAYIATHYCTSKNSGIQLCDKQFKIFQNEHDNPGTVFVSTKVQNIVPLTTPLIIKKEDIPSRVYLDKEYLNTVPEDVKQAVALDIRKRIKNPAQEFNKSGITKQDCIDMCREHDKTVEKKGKHPLTVDQIKQNEENKKKQQDENKKKKEEDSKLKSQNDKSD